MVVHDVEETRSDSSGRFAIGGIPAGTRHVQTWESDWSPLIRAVDIPLATSFVQTSTTI